MTEAHNISPWGHPRIERFPEPAGGHPASDHAPDTRAKPGRRKIVRVIVPLVFVLVWVVVLAAIGGASSGACDPSDPSHTMTTATK